MHLHDHEAKSDRGGQEQPARQVSPSRVEQPTQQEHACQGGCIGHGLREQMRQQRQAQYAQQKHAADALYEKHRHIVVQPSAEFGARMLQAGKNGEQRRAAVALQLVMKPANFREFSLLRSSLDAVPVADRRTPLGLHATQLYIDLPFAALRPLDEVRQGIAAIREQLPAALGARSLLQLVPDPRLHGEFRNYVPAQPTDATYPEERAS